MNRCGIRYVQLALVPVLDDPSWQDTATVLRDAGVEIISGMLETVGEDYSSLASIATTGGVSPDETWQATLKRAKNVAQIAAEMKLPLVTMHAGFLPEEQGEKRSTMIDRLRQLGDLFGAKKIDLAFETGQETGDVLVDVLQELSHPNIGVNFDPANMILYNKGNPVAAMETLSPWIKQIHIKDAVVSEVEGAWGSEVPVGTGDVDWESFLARVPDGVDLIIEREAGENRISDIRTAITLLKANGIC
jgi:sugar phosphate isomerase/epimerase